MKEETLGDWLERGKRHQPLQYYKVILSDENREICESPEAIAADGVETNKTYFIPTFKFESFENRKYFNTITKGKGDEIMKPAIDKHKERERKEN